MLYILFYYSEYLINRFLLVNYTFHKNFFVIHFQMYNTYMTISGQYLYWMPLSTTIVADVVEHLLIVL